jgi:hypothetical protein
MNGFYPEEMANWFLFSHARYLRNTAACMKEHGSAISANRSGLINATVHRTDSHRFPIKND